MTRLLAPTLILLAVILLAVNVPALAVDRTFQIEIENSLKGTVPPSWWLHASWRDQTLVVFVSPPVQESFDLWYDTPRQKETLENLCKAIPGAIWNQIQPDQDIAVRAGCRRQWRQRQFSVLVPKISGQVDRLMAILDETTHAMQQHPSDEGRTMISLTHGSLVCIDPACGCPARRQQPE